MTTLHITPLRHVKAPPPLLHTVEADGRRYLHPAAEALVMRACRAKGLGFDLFATRFNVPRAMLLDILRGHEPVSSHTQRILDDFVFRTLGPAAILPRATA